MTCLSPAGLAGSQRPYPWETLGSAPCTYFLLLWIFFLHPALPSPLHHHLAPKSRAGMPSSGGCLYNTHSHRHQSAHSPRHAHTDTPHVHTYIHIYMCLYMYVYVHAHWYTNIHMHTYRSRNTGIHTGHELAHAYTPMQTHIMKCPCVSEMAWVSSVILGPQPIMVSI